MVPPGAKGNPSGEGAVPDCRMGDNETPAGKIPTARSARTRWIGVLTLLLAVAAFSAIIILRRPVTSTPMEAFDVLVAALKSGDEARIREATTGKGFESVRDESIGYVEHYAALGQKMTSMRPYILKNGWSQVDSQQASSGVSWSGGSGRKTNEILMVKTATGWKLQKYQTIWDR